MPATVALLLGLLIVKNTFAYPEFYYLNTLGVFPEGYSDCASHPQPYENNPVKGTILPNGDKMPHSLRAEKPSEVNTYILTNPDGTVVTTLCPGVKQTLTVVFGGNTRRGALLSASSGAFNDPTPDCPTRVDLSKRFRANRWNTTYLTPCGATGSVLFKMTSSTGTDWIQSNWTAEINPACGTVECGGDGTFPVLPSSPDVEPASPSPSTAPSSSPSPPPVYGAYPSPPRAPRPPPSPRPPKAPKVPARPPRVPPSTPPPAPPPPADCYQMTYGYGYGGNYGYGYSGYQGGYGYGYAYGYSYGYSMDYVPCPAPPPSIPPSPPSPRPPRPPPRPPKTPPSTPPPSPPQPLGYYGASYDPPAPAYPSPPSPRAPKAPKRPSSPRRSPPPPSPVQQAPAYGPYNGGYGYH